MHMRMRMLVLVVHERHGWRTNVSAESSGACQTLGVLAAAVGHAHCMVDGLFRAMSSARGSLNLFLKLKRQKHVCVTKKIGPPKNLLKS